MLSARRALWAGLFGLLLLTSNTNAQEKAEDISQGFRAYIAAEPRFPAADVRNRTGKMHDLVTENGLNPVIAVFARAIPADDNGAVATLIKLQDQLVDEYRLKRLSTFAVFLALKDEFRKDESRDARLKEIAKFVEAAKPTKTTLGLSEATETPDGSTQAGIPAQVTAMGIAPEDEIVVVFYNRLGVVKRWKFKADAAPSEADLTGIRSEIEKVLGAPKKRPAPAPTPVKDKE